MLPVHFPATRILSYGYCTGKEASVEDIAADLLDQLVKIRKNDVSVVKVGQIPH